MSRYALALIKAASLVFLCCWSALPALAQTQKPEPLIVPFNTVTPLLPFVFVNKAGERSGFFVDLAEMIGAEIGVPISYLDVSTPQEFLGAQSTGRTQLIAGIVQLPAIKGTSIFSDPVAIEHVRPAILESNRAGFEAAPFVGRSIGVVKPFIGSGAPILRDNRRVEYGSIELAFIDLLTGKVDAVIAPEAAIYTFARDADVDARIGFFGAPTRQITRHVALHESRADLLPAINEVIARLHADGRLAALLDRYGITVPPPPPETLTVGINHAPPYGTVGPDGQISGFTAEMWTEIASRANISIQFKAVSGEVYSSGPTVAAGIDAVGLLFMSEQRAARMDFTLPLQQIDYRLFFRKDNPPADPAYPFADRRIGVLPQSLSDETRAKLANYDVVNAPSIDALVDGLIDGTYDKILTLPKAAQKLFQERGVAEDVQVFEGAFFTSELAPALRPGLGAVRARLNGVIPGYLLSHEHAALRQKYFGKPMFWTDTRIYVAIGMAAATFLSLVGFLIWQRQQQQHRALVRERAHSKELAGVVMQLENANREQAEFTYSISHDLKSPANTIGMLIDELSEVEQLGTDGQSLLNDMSRTNQHMRQLVDDVLGYSRIVEDGMDIETVDVDTMLSEICGDLRSAIEEAHAELTILSLPSVRGSRMQLRILFQNLLSNAIKFRAAGRQPRIEVSGRRLSDSVQIIVSDNGIGIPEEHRERVLGLFQRLNSQTAYEGTGLGLTICQRVMSNHGGNLEIASRIGGGSSFIVTFPENLQ